MANTIALAEQFLPILDGIYKAESKSAILAGANSGIVFRGGNKVDVFKTAMDGLGNYSRSTGFPAGSITAGWETLTLTHDRGVSLTVDAMDNEETLGMAFGTLLGEFVRTQEIPEVDAVTFATLASASNIDGGTPADITVGTTDVPGLIDAAEESMGDNEVPREGRILFVSEKAYAGLKAKITRYLANENGVNKEVETYNGMRVVRVPQGRFNTAVTLNTGSGTFGFAPTAGGYKINFLIVEPSAVRAVVKHDLLRVFSPEENQNADAWKLNARLYYDAFVLSNKVKGIYLHRASTANT